MIKPKYVYAANRNIGLKLLKALIAHDWYPECLLVMSDEHDNYISEMKYLLDSIPVMEGNYFKKEEGLKTLQNFDLDYIFMIHFPLIIPKSVLSIPKIGILNLHPAFLPFNRGWHTPSWAIEEDTEYGATLHWLDEGIDTGDIALQKKLTIHPDDTANNLYQRVLALEEELFIEAIPLMIEKKLPRIPQKLQGTSHTKKDLKKIQKLDLEDSLLVGDIIKRLKALTTNKWSEAAFFESKDKKYYIQIDIKEEE